MYYAADYIDPTLRYNKTELFNTFEQSINNSRLTEKSVKSALQSYLISYEKLAQIDTIKELYVENIKTHFSSVKPVNHPANIIGVVVNNCLMIAIIYAGLNGKKSIAISMAQKKNSLSILVGIEVVFILIGLINSPLGPIKMKPQRNIITIVYTKR